MINKEVIKLAAKTKILEQVTKYLFDDMFEDKNTRNYFKNIFKQLGYSKMMFYSKSINCSYGKEKLIISIEKLKTTLEIDTSLNSSFELLTSSKVQNDDIIFINKKLIDYGIVKPRNRFHTIHYVASTGISIYNNPQKIIKYVIGFVLAIIITFSMLFVALDILIGL